MPGDKIEKARSVEYLPVPGAMLSPADAAVIGPAVEGIKRGGGTDRPKLSDVVEAARPKEAPLHRFFEWDNGKAARKFRIEQARWLVRSVRVVVRYVSGSTAEHLLTQQVRIVEKSTGLLSPSPVLEVKTAAVLVSEGGGAAPPAEKTALQEIAAPQAPAREESKPTRERSIGKPRLVSFERFKNLSPPKEEQGLQKKIEEPSLSASAENSKLLIDAVHELLAWKRKYILLSGVTGLKGVFLAINELEGK